MVTSSKESWHSNQPTEFLLLFQYQWEYVPCNNTILTRQKNSMTAVDATSYLFYQIPASIYVNVSHAIFPIFKGRKWSQVGIDSKMSKPKKSKNFVDFLPVRGYNLLHSIQTPISTTSFDNDFAVLLLIRWIYLYLTENQNRFSFPDNFIACF